MELREKSFATPGILDNAGLEVCIITDAPVIPLYYLPLCAGLAVKAGMKEESAWRAITINPAHVIGIADRVGSLEVGKDADIAIFDGRSPAGYSVQNQGCVRQWPAGLQRLSFPLFSAASLSQRGGVFYLLRNSRSVHHLFIDIH